MFYMEYNEEQQAFYKKIKDKIKDGRKNLRTVPKDFQEYVKLLTDYIPQPSLRKREIEDRTRENKNYNKLIFVLAFSQDMKLKSNNIFQISDKKLSSILFALTELSDVHLFISISSFFPESDINCNPILKRNQKQCSRSNVLIADIDSYHSERCKDLTPEQTLQLIKKERPQFFTDEMPLTVVKSGNGLQLYLNIASCDLFTKSDKHFWRVLNKRFNDFFLEYGADPKCSSDITRIFRIPYSTNCKNNKSKPVEFLSEVKTTPIGIDKLAQIMNLTGEDFNYRDDEYLKRKRINEKLIKDERLARQKDREKVEKRKKHIEYLKWTKTANPTEVRQMEEWKANGKKGIETLVKKRLADLEKLLELRDADIEGCRNNFLFIYGSTHFKYYSDIEDTSHKLYELNRFFSEPISESELESTIKSIEKHNYTKFTNEYIMNVLQITEEESKELSLCYTIEQRKEHLSNKAKAKYKSKLPEGTLTLTEKAIINQEYVKTHMDTPAADLAKELNISKSHIYAIKRRIRNQ